MKTVNIYTDGACSGNQNEKNKGGWGCVLEYNGREKELSGGEADTTNNRMELTALIEGLSALKEKGLSRVTADNIVAIEIGRELGLKVHGGFCLNILNSVSLDEYKALGLEDACLSMELTYSRLRDIRPTVPVGAVVYGRLPLMKLRACPARGEKGCGSCRGYNELKDRKGEYFPLVCREREYSEILNCLPQYTADKSLPENCFRLLWFTIESTEECRYVMDLCRRGEYPDMTRTAGLTQRDIE